MGRKTIASIIPPLDSPGGPPSWLHCSPPTSPRFPGSPRDGTLKRRHTANDLAEALSHENAGKIICERCGSECALVTEEDCRTCQQPPKLQFGGYRLGRLKNLYNSETGPALCNSVVMVTKAHRVKDKEEDGGYSEFAKERELLVAVKSVHRKGNPADVQMAQREIRLFEHFGKHRHPNLLPLLYGMETDTHLVLLSPYAPGGDLHSLTCVAGNTFKCLEEVDAGALASQMLSGILALHNARFLHGDVKPHNVFLTKITARTGGGFLRQCSEIDDEVFVAQLGDFGLSRFVPECDDCVPSEGGTAGYMAPEMVGRVLGQEGPQVSFSIDLWAVGIIMYQLLSSMSPFDPPSNVRAKLEFDDMCWEPLLPEAREFVSALLEKCPLKRGTAESALAHPWLRASKTVPRGKQRKSFAPHPDAGLRFRFHVNSSQSELMDIDGAFSSETEKRPSRAHTSRTTVF